MIEFLYICMFVDRTKCPHEKKNMSFYVGNTSFDDDIGVLKLTFYDVGSYLLPSYRFVAIVSESNLDETCAQLKTNGTIDAIECNLFEEPLSSTPSPILVDDVESTIETILNVFCPSDNIKG